MSNRDINGDDSEDEEVARMQTTSRNSYARGKQYDASSQPSRLLSANSDAEARTPKSNSQCSDIAKV
jgi:hypothetical protein